MESLAKLNFASYVACVRMNKHLFCDALKRNNFFAPSMRQVERSAMLVHRTAAAAAADVLLNVFISYLRAFQLRATVWQTAVII